MGREATGSLSKPAVPSEAQQRLESDSKSNIGISHSQIFIYLRGKGSDKRKVNSDTFPKKADTVGYEKKFFFDEKIIIIVG